MTAAPPGGRVLPGTAVSLLCTRRPETVLLSAQVAELYEELKSRISQFNMNAGSRRPALDQEYTHKQRFILQVRVVLPFLTPGLPPRPLCLPGRVGSTLPAAQA